MAFFESPMLFGFGAFDAVSVTVTHHQTLLPGKQTSKRLKSTVDGQLHSIKLNRKENIQRLAPTCLNSLSKPVRVEGKLHL